MKHGAYAAVLLCAALMLSACKQTVNVPPTGPAPVTPPTTPTPSISQIFVAAITQGVSDLNKACPQTFVFQATAYSNAGPVNATWVWASTGGQFTYEKDTSKIVVNAPGVYTITATGTVNGESKTTEVKLTITGDGCAPGPGPGPTDLRIDPAKIVLYPSTCPQAGVSSAMIESNLDVEWRNSNQGVATLEKKSAREARVTFVAPGTTTVTGRSADGQEEEVQVTSNTCPVTPPPPPPPAAPACLSLIANDYDVVRGTAVQISWTSNAATERVEGFGDWNRSSLPPNGSETIVPPNASNTISIRCHGAPGTTPDTRTIVITTHEAPAVCPNSVGYQRADGTAGGGPIAVGQSIELVVTGLPEDSPCRPFWGVDRPDRGVLAGADGVEIIDGKQYPVGRRAVVKRIYPGIFGGFVQPSVVNTNKTWHTWTDATSMSMVPSGPEPTVNIMFEVRADGSVWYNGLPVEQTGPPKK